MIEAQQLTKWYGPHLALDRVDLAAPQGRVLGFLGPNGAGKSTTLRILTGYMPATSGSAVINGHTVTDDPFAVRRSIGYLPESTPLYPELRVREQLHLFGRFHHMSRSDRRARIDYLTDRCGLDAIINRPIGQLSKGNKQRVGLAQAMLHDPPVIILDEPTAGLDPAQIRDVRQLIRSLAQKKTILLSTHILSEAEQTCDSLTIINRGRIVATGSPDQLKRQARAQSRIVMETAADPQSVRATLAALPAVADVQHESADDRWTTITITTTPQAGDIREQLAQTAADQQWLVRELRHEIGSLEAYFIQAIDGEQKQSA